MPNLVGIGLSQVPTNSMLGGLAYQSPDHASIKDLDLKNLSQINSEIADTAVDIFIYDTSKDSDGGAWRKRTTHTSWYNETLNTATRGSRKEFPAVAVLVLEGTKLTIYDGDDPDLPMWMKFEASGGNWNDGVLPAFNGYVAISALNGIICVASTNNSYGVVKIQFISDDAYSHTSVTSYGGYDSLGLSQRNSSGHTFLTGTGAVSLGVLVNNYVNDVAMTVLPNALSDSATGLPIPTIAVATNGGVSVIKDDGTVVDITWSSYGIASSVYFKDNYLWLTNDSGISNNGGRYLKKYSIPSSDISESQGYLRNSALKYWASPWGFLSSYTGTSYPPLLGSNAGFYGPTVGPYWGSSGGLTIIGDEGTTTTNGLVAYATTSYNTGWMHGDIKGAFLSDTDATNAVGTELHPNGNSDFSSTDVSYISNTAGGTATVTSGQLVLSGGITANYSDHVLTVNNLEVGAQYIITIDYVAKSAGAGSIGFYVNGSYLPEANDGSGYIARSAGNSYSFYFTTLFSSRTIDLVTGGNSSQTHTFDNWSIKKVEEDRSVNQKGLQVFGTVTKSAVATGAELVGYSFGGNNSNYLEQPYNSALDFGTGGDFYYSIWFKTDSNDTYSGSYDYLFERSSIGDPSSNRVEARLNSATLVDVYAFGTGFVSGSSGLTVGANVWNKLDILRSSGTGYVYINGVLKASGSNAGNATDSNATLVIGNRAYFNPKNSTLPTNTQIALFKVSASAPSAEQIKKMYEDEKVLFQENAKCTLYGSSDAVKALAYDEVTEQLHVGTSSGRSDFQGLRRINNTTTAVTTAISAHDEFIVEQ